MNARQRQRTNAAERLAAITKAFRTPGVEKAFAAAAMLAEVRGGTGPQKRRTAGGIIAAFVDLPIINEATEAWLIDAGINRALVALGLLGRSHPAPAPVVGSTKKRKRSKASK